MAEGRSVGERFCPPSFLYDTVYPHLGVFRKSSAIIGCRSEM